MTDAKKPLANARHEAFALAIAKGSKQSAAYLEAGYKATGDAAYVCASQLLRRPKVAARVAHLQERAADETILTKAWLIQQAQGILADARQDRAHSAAARMVELLGRERNTFVEKKEIGRPGDFSGMADDELDDFIAREAGELGRGAPGKTDTPRSDRSPGKPH